MRLIVALILLIVGISVVRWIVEAARKNRPQGPASTEMIQDPNCHTYIPETEAVKATIGGREYCFCSEKCAEEYRGKHSAV